MFVFPCGFDIHDTHSADSSSYQHILAYLRLHLQPTPH